jgi:DNA primase large subunit
MNNKISEGLKRYWASSAAARRRAAADFKDSAKVTGALAAGVGINLAIIPAALAGAAAPERYKDKIYNGRILTAAGAASDRVDRFLAGAANNIRKRRWASAEAKLNKIREPNILFNQTARIQELEAKNAKRFNRIYAADNYARTGQRFSRVSFDSKGRVIP